MTTNLKKCLVIGGSGYVGYEVCRTLAANGAAVGFTYYQNRERAAALSAEFSDCRGYPLELGNIPEIHRVVSRIITDLDGVDALIHCAGSRGGTTDFVNQAQYMLDQFTGLDAATWDDEFNVNTKSVFAVCQTVVKQMQGEGPFNLVLLGSLNAAKPVPAPVAYAASKGALKSLVEVLSKTLGERHICVNLVAPGILEQGASCQVHDDLKKEYLKHCALGRLGTAEDIARFMSWLALENTYMTGQTILLDGGL
ncbi:MAG: SDR family oxidoreductase [Deltaproteobacteria bacterium]|nr:SDR family oxidoreductase [Deltaproteobacteria bacterium]